MNSPTPELEFAQLRVPPQSIEAESAVLGAILLDNKSFDHISDLIRHNDFYKFQHQLIFIAISELIKKAHPADVITVFAHLNSIGKSSEAGGIDYLNLLAQYVPSISNIRKYAELVRDKSIMRLVIGAGDEIASSGFNNKGLSAETILEEAQRKILAIGEKSGTGEKNELKPLHDQILQFIDNLQNLAENPNQQIGVHSGFDALDHLTNGFQAGDLIVIAGRPSMGKTAIGLNIAQYTAIHQKLPVLLISLEMSTDQLTQRLVGAIGGVNQTTFKTGQLTDMEWGRVLDTLEVVKNLNIDIQDTGMNSVSAIRTLARKWARKYKKPGLILIDYLQLMGGEDHAGKSSPENRATELAQISRGLKLLAKEIGCPIIALSQLNRSVESRPDKRPLMGDLRESGAIEQDADTIIFIYRDDYYTKDASKEPGVAEIIISKQRNGPVGTIKLSWIPHYTRFENMA